MKNWILALAALAVVESGCSPVVLEALESKATQGSASPPVPGSTALAIRGGNVTWVDKFSLVPEDPLPIDGFWGNPDSLLLFFSDDLQTCSDPIHGPNPFCTDSFWQKIIAIPPELNRPGLIDMGDYRIRIYSPHSGSTLITSSGQVYCAQGASSGAMDPGVIEIVSSDANTLSLKLHGIVVEDGVLEGDYTAQICGALPVTAPPTPVPAIRGANIPVISGGTLSVGGAAPDPDSLFVVLGSPPDTCQSPWRSDDCTNQLRLDFSLPLALQKPGLLDLSDPAIAATYGSGGSGGKICDPGRGTFESGTLEILSFDATSFTFRVYGSVRYTQEARYIAMDGLYTAQICP